MLNRYGWAIREVKEVARPAGMPAAESHAILREFWFTEWQRQDAEALRKKREEIDRAQAARAKSIWDEFGPPGKYRRFTEEQFDVSTAERRDALEKTLLFPYADADYLEDTLSTLALLGPKGTGKTLLASLWLRQQVLHDQEDGMFTTAAQLVRTVRDTWGTRGTNETAALERFCTVRNLVIDDVGVDTGEHAVSVLMEVLDARLANEVLTCYTTNASGTQLLEIYGPRGFSRLMANAQVLGLGGPDRRIRTA